MSTELLYLQRHGSAVVVFSTILFFSTHVYICTLSGGKKYKSKLFHRKGIDPVPKK